MKSAVDVDDAAVQQMVEESVEHAFDDLKARQWIEAKLRAEETVKATRSGLTECGEDLPTDQRAKIEAALGAVETLLAAENPQTKIGEPTKLKAANTALDQATQPLAEILMDRAMEALLRKRGIIQ